MVEVEALWRCVGREQDRSAQRREIVQGSGAFFARQAAMEHSGRPADGASQLQQGVAILREDNRWFPDSAQEASQGGNLCLPCGRFARSVCKIPEHHLLAMWIVECEAGESRRTIGIVGVALR